MSVKTDVVKYIALPVVLPLILLFLIFSWVTIGAGQIGIVTLFGKLQAFTLSSGAHFINPFAVVHKINIRTLTTTGDSEAASKDLQTVHTNLTLNYSIDPAAAKELYQSVGSSPEYLEKSIIQPAMTETFKAVVAMFSAEDLVNKRDAVSVKIQDTLEAKLKQFGIMIKSISVTNFQFSQTFNQAIEAKVTAQQNVLTAQNDLDRMKIEAQQKVVQAKAEADALNLQRMAITPELIQLRQTENQTKAIEKWNGQLPMYTGSNIPFIMPGK